MVWMLENKGTREGRGECFRAAWGLDVSYDSSLALFEVLSPSVPAGVD